MAELVGDGQMLYLQRPRLYGKHGLGKGNRMKLQPGAIQYDRS
jgi:hypothetical protein